ncbi:MAG TPA: ribosome small subunit-dependent GTPase A [Jiangellaceae bacterium]|nr:ribosome small subunit-dependent GTPase A [Jiangellaceae bacterium]
MSSSAAGHASLRDLGWDESLDLELAARAAGLEPARVSRVDRGAADLLGRSGPVRATYGRDVLAAIADDRTALPTVGDWAALATWPDGRTTIETLLPRRTQVVRDGADRTSHGQVLAANVDLVVIVEHLEPDPDLGRIERLLVLAWGSGAQPLVVLTKTDLVPDPNGMVAQVSSAVPGAEVLGVSAATGDGLDAVQAHLAPGRTLVLLGPSGAGKSTLTNALAGAELMATRGLRADGRGRHTTTHRELVALPGVGVVLDTPGLRSVGVVGDTDAMRDAFPEIAELAAECRFRDCAHETEPGCAVLAAVEDGALDERRLASWRKLGREAAYQARRTDARLRAAELAVWKRRHKAMRERYKHQPRKR